MAKVRIRRGKNLRTANRFSVASFANNKQLWDNYMAGRVVSVERHEIPLIKSAELIQADVVSAPAVTPKVYPREVESSVSPVSVKVENPSTEETPLSKLKAQAPTKGESK